MVISQHDKTPAEENIQTVIRLLAALHALLERLIEAIQQVDLFTGQQKLMFLQAVRQDCEILLELVLDTKRVLCGLTTSEELK